MKSTCCTLALLASASAFTPTAFTGKAVAHGAKSSSAVRMGYANDASEIPGRPFGPDGPIFDPLGLSRDAEPELLKRYQECELKHGRVAMLASAGYLLQEKFHPLFGFGDVDIGPALRHFQIVESRVPFFWEIVVIAIGLIETRQIARGFEKRGALSPGGADLKADYIPGDLGFDPLNLAPTSDPDNFNTMRVKELNNGRLAMIAIMGFWAQQLVDGQPILPQ